MSRFAMVICGFALAAAAHAEPLAYPGAMWGSVLFPSGLSGPENRDLLVTGRIEQGAVWLRFGEDNAWRLNTYAALSYSVDDKGLGYNNRYAPAIGVKVQRIFGGGILDLGMQLARERRFKDNATSTGVQAYANWWLGWDLKR